MLAVLAVPQSISEAGAQLRQGKTSSVALTRAFLSRAETLDPLLGTFVTRLDETAMAQAERADADFSQGIDKGPLQGIPLGVKDIIADSDGPTTAQSLILDRLWAADKDAPVVRRLKRAGAVIVGKTTTMEFAHGAPDGTKPFPLPRNPWDVSRYPGGSSSGTANGIAAGLFLGGLGTDTGGSIRGPSALCGITGLKPTFGRVPKTGCVPLGFSLDHVGPLARSAEDCGLILNVIAGYHPSDPQCSKREWGQLPPLSHADIGGLRIGVDRVHPEGIQSGDSAEAFGLALDVLAALGAELVEVELPLYQEMVSIVAVTRFAEAYAYHRGDLQSRWTDYGATTRVNLSRGALISSSEYVQAQRVRRVVQRKLVEVFGRVDIMASPTTGAIAEPYLSFDDEFTLSPEGGQFSNMGYWSPSGFPVMALPMGLAEDMPVSLQLASSPFSELTLLKAGHAFQQATQWHRLWPPVAELN